MNVHVISNLRSIALLGIALALAGCTGSGAGLIPKATAATSSASGQTADAGQTSQGGDSSGSGQQASGSADSGGDKQRGVPPVGTIPLGLPKDVVLKHAVLL